MKGCTQFSTSFGDGTNFQTFFSFGDEWPEETNKENQFPSTRRSRIAGKDNQEQIEKTMKASKMTVPANLFKPWFTRGLSERVNKKLASELHKLVKNQEKPKQIVKPDNKVLKVYRSNRSQSRDNSQRGSSVGSSVMSRSSERHSIKFPKQAVPIDQQEVEERCKKYYSDYLRVRINQRPSQKNNVSTLEDSSSQIYPSMFLSKMALEGSNFLLHLASINTHDSLELKNQPQKSGMSIQSVPLVSSNLELKRDSSNEVDGATAAYGFKRRNSSSKLEEKRTEKKLASKPSIFLSKEDPRKANQGKLEKKVTKEITFKNNFPSSKPNHTKRTSKSPPCLQKSSNLQCKTLKNMVNTHSKVLNEGSNTVDKNKGSIFSSSNIIKNSYCSMNIQQKFQNKKPIQIIKKTETPCIEQYQSNPASGSIQIASNSPRSRLPFGLTPKLQQSSSKTESKSKNILIVPGIEGSHFSECPTCGNKNAFQSMDELLTQLRLESISINPTTGSPKKPTITMINNLSALTSYMRSRSLDT